MKLVATALGCVLACSMIHRVNAEAAKRIGPEGSVAGVPHADGYDLSLFRAADANKKVIATVQIIKGVPYRFELIGGQNLIGSAVDEIAGSIGEGIDTGPHMKKFELEATSGEKINIRAKCHDEILTDYTLEGDKITCRDHWMNRWVVRTEPQKE